MRLAGRSSIPCYYHQLKSESSGFIVSKRTGFFNFVTGAVDSTALPRTANDMHACDMNVIGLCAPIGATVKNYIAMG